MKGLGGLALCAAMALGGCSGDELNRPALEEALARALPRDAAPRPTPGALVAPTEPHAVDLNLSLSLTPPGSDPHLLTLHRRILRGAQGAFRVLDERRWWDPTAAPDGATEGSEAIFDGQRLVTRRRWAPWQERSTWAGDQEAVLRDAYDGFGDLLAAFEPYLRLTRAQRERIFGVDAQWFDVALVPDLRPKALDAATLAGLREHETGWITWIAATHRPSTVKGRVARRIGTGEVVAGDLALEGTAGSAARPVRFKFKLAARPKALPADASFAIPSDAPILPERRERTWLMIREVVGDALEPIYRRGAR